ncbi:hypothetical protein Tco_0530168 [Tanacetum coccineum]
MLERPNGFHYVGQGNLFASRCLEYIRRPPHRARTSSPTLDGSLHCSYTTYSSEQEWSPRHSVLHGNPEQALVEYASSRTDEARGLVSHFMASQDARLSKFEADFKRQQSDMTDKIDTVLKDITDQIVGALPSDTVKNLKLNVNSTTPDDDSHIEEPEMGSNVGVGESEVEYFDVFPTKSELAYHKGKLDPRENINGGVNNFIGRIKGMHIFVRNFTYIIDFMIIEDISSIIDPRLSQVVLGRPFVEISNMTHDPPKDVIRFTNGTNEIAYKLPHKIEQYDSLSDIERVHTKSVYFRNEENKRRGVEYVMSKILGFYKECLELGPEYMTGIADEGEVTQRLYLMRRSLEVLRKFHWMILGGRFNQLSHVSSPLLSKPWEY